MSEPPKPPPNDRKNLPGWNDPPMLNYTADNPPPKSRIKNKRVPFPLDAPSAPPPDVNLPQKPEGPHKT